MSNKTTKLNEEKKQNNTKEKLNENVNIPKEQGLSLIHISEPTRPY